MAMTADPDVDTAYMAPSSFPEPFLLANEVIDPLIQSVIAQGADVDEALTKAQSDAAAVIEKIK